MTVPIIELAGATTEELKDFVRQSVDLDVEDDWIDLYAKTSGYRCGYLFQRICYIRLVSAKLYLERKCPWILILDELKLHVLPKMARQIKAVRVTQVNPETAMRFGRAFGDLPPMYQTFVEVLTIATSRCFYHVPLTVVRMAMEDLFLESELEEAFPVDIAVAELEEMFILAVHGEGENKRIHLQSPAFADTVLAVCTPIQVEAIAAALVDRLEECKASKTLVDHLVIAGLAGTLGDVAKQHEQWKLAYEALLEESVQMDDKTIKCNKQLIEEEIQIGGGDGVACIGVDLAVESPTFPAIDPLRILLRYYSGPVAFEPMGHTLSVISRSCVYETKATKHCAGSDELRKLQQDISSGVSRYLEQMRTVKTYLDEHGFGASPAALVEETSILQRLLTVYAKSQTDSFEKAGIFLKQLIPNHIEPRIDRLWLHVQRVWKEGVSPHVIENAENNTIRMAYSAMQQDIDRNDALQDSLVTLALLNWMPKKVPECLPLFYYQTVATLRYRIMRKLAGAELVIFHHQQRLRTWKLS